VAKAKVMATLPARALRNADSVRQNFFQAIIMASHQEMVEPACRNKDRY
jgi:hypothetical protein